MPLKRHVIEVQGGATHIRFSRIETPPSSSVIDFNDMLKSTTPEVTPKAREVDREGMLLAKFRKASSPPFQISLSA
jgi:hypothetical protein